MAWNKTQQVVLAILPKISSVLSLFGSAWIAIEVLTETDIPKRKHPYHRLLFAMSVYDILESLWNFTSTWPIPKGTENVFGASGNTATCSAQGFFLTLSVAVPIYNALLSLYYLLVINYNFKDTQLRRWVEPSMHAIAFIWAFGTATSSAAMGLLNNANLWCWIAPYPSDCLDSLRYPDEANCIRGDNAWAYRWVNTLYWAWSGWESTFSSSFLGIFYAYFNRWAFYFAPLWFCIVFASKSIRDAMKPSGLLSVQRAVRQMLLTHHLFMTFDRCMHFYGVS